jgi:hypothetical protein
MYRGFDELQVLAPEATNSILQLAHNWACQPSKLLPYLYRHIAPPPTCRPTSPSTLTWISTTQAAVHCQQVAVGPCLAGLPCRCTASTASTCWLGLTDSAHLHAQQLWKEVGWRNKSRFRSLNRRCENCETKASKLHRPPPPRAPKLPALAPPSSVCQWLARTG